MKLPIRSVLSSSLRSLTGSFSVYRSWEKNRFAAPAPHFVKREVLLRNGAPDACWVETGTYLGETTEFLARHASRVISIEPGAALFRRAQTKFARADNIELINDLSENALPGLLPRLSGNVNFWLDGHYSAGVTFRGPNDTPIAAELECIRENTLHFDKLTVLIDDVRCFNPRIKEYATYPGIDFLVDWARQMKMPWHIEHDIFVVRNH